MFSEHDHVEFASLRCTCISRAPCLLYIEVAIDAACFQPLTDWPLCCFFGSLLDAEFDALWCVQLVIFMLCTALSSMLSVHRGLKHDGCPDLSGFFIKTGFVLDICFCYSQVCEVLYLTRVSLGGVRRKCNPLHARNRSSYKIH